MTKKQKQELARIEKQIIKLAHYIGGHRMHRSRKDWDKETRSQLKELFSWRCLLLNQMFQGSPDEIATFKLVNDRLNELTKKMHAKTLKIYRSILKQGYDPEFDDDIMVEGTLKYVFDDDGSITCPENEEYGSNFEAMLDILYNLYEEECASECAFCQASYSLAHKPDMPASEFGLDDFLDDGESWNEAPLNRSELKSICICHVVHDLCCHKYYSIPDLLRMNDFRVDVIITYQHFVNRDGRRFSCIEPYGED